MLVLAIDTATPAVTVALAEGSRVLAERTSVDPRRHGEVLAPTIAAVLADAGAHMADLGVIAVGAGPGPYTGLRVGLVTADVLGATLGIEVLGVCSLDVLARGAGLAGEHRVATDARRHEVYWAAYDGPRRVAGPHVDRPADVAWDGPAVGAGALLYPESFPAASGPAYPRAGDMCRLLAAGGEQLPPRPLYLRHPDAVVPGPAKRVTR